MENSIQPETDRQNQSQPEDRAAQGLIKRFGEVATEAQIIAAFTSAGILLGFSLVWYTVGARVQIALLWALACLAIGATVGFMFGIPRVVQPDNNQASDSVTQYRVNSSLEQIADWLTKIIVGLGLIQLTKLPGLLQGLASYIAAGFPDVVHAEVFALALVLYFLVFGFVSAYLMTRVFLVPAFKKADAARATARGPADSGGPR
jgi:hypothetical protein